MLTCPTQKYAARYPFRMIERIAIIDMGTNTFHLLVAEWREGELQILHREKMPVKLGMGGINQDLITVEAIHRGLMCLRNFAVLLKKWQVHKAIGFGTSALRSARNGKDIIELFRRETGMNLKLISGEEEAEYIYYGVRSALDLGLEKSLIVDIGGGSVEFIVADREMMYWKRSFEMGAQRLLELYHKHEPIPAEEIHQLGGYFENQLKPLAEAVRRFVPQTLVGSSGTFDTLSEIYCIRKGIDIGPDSPETPLSVPDFFTIHNELISKNRSERMQIPGMIEMRVDMIVVASCLVKYLIDTYSFKRIRVSSYSLKEGVLARWKDNSEPGRQTTNQ